MKINHRIYFNSFSVHGGLCIAALALAVLAMTPLAEISMPRLINQNLKFTLLLVSSLIMLVGFRGNSSMLKGMHVVVAIGVAIIPSVFAAMILAGTGIGLVARFIFTCIDLFGGGGIQFSQLAADVYGIMIEVIPWVLAAVVVWIVVKRKVFDLYRNHHAIDLESKLNVTLVLLMFFGAFGAHRFFCGKIVSGLLYLFTMGLLGFGVIFDGIMLLIGKFEDSEGNRI